MRPRTLEEFAGQEHILAGGRLLRRAIEADQLSSLIFSGPPGTGKTTLARIIAQTTKSRFKSINAVLSGVKDIREAIEEAKNEKAYYGKRTILFIDEVHRWNKAQQDALLPWVENGTVILIGATTENPYFEVNPALVSRSRVFQLKSLARADLEKIMNQCIADPVRGYGQFKLTMDEDARGHLLDAARGDARSLLGAMELAVETSVPDFPPVAGTELHITLDIAEDSIQQKAVLYDKSGDYHYDSISAFIKSLRGSDPDAALYWMARMINAGESPRFIFRRMLISASEDIGLADPLALGQVQSAAEAFDRVGMPEGQFFLAQAALYLATAPKSNSALGYFDALETVKKEIEASEIPNHLKDGNRDKEGFGHGEGYRYPHAFADHWVAQNYLPKNLRGQIFYHGGSLGEEGLRYPDVLRRRELQLESDDDPFSEILSFSGARSEGGKQREQWIRRSEGALADSWEQLRRSVFDILKAEAGLQRHSRICIEGRHIGPLVWEALRRCPEGLTMVRFSDPDEEERMRYLSGQLPELEAPIILPPAGGETSANRAVRDASVLGPKSISAGDVAGSGDSTAADSGAAGSGDSAAGSQHGTAAGADAAHRRYSEGPETGGPGSAEYADTAAGTAATRTTPEYDIILRRKPGAGNAAASAGSRGSSGDASVHSRHSTAADSGAAGSSHSATASDSAGGRAGSDTNDGAETAAGPGIHAADGAVEAWLSPAMGEKPSFSLWFSRLPGVNEDLAARFISAEQRYFNPREHSTSQTISKELFLIEVDTGNLPSPAQVRQWFENEKYLVGLKQYMKEDEIELIARESAGALEAPRNLPPWKRWYALQIF